MIMNDLYDELEKLSKRSEFNAKLSHRGGYITFSNSGRRGGSKSFQIGLDSLLQTLKDIRTNLTEFIPEYVETDWRNSGSAYFTDPTANATSTVQTKPLFSTLSKIIIWGNQPILDGVDSDNTIVLESDAITNAIDKLEILADAFKPSGKIPCLTGKELYSVTQTIFFGSPGTGKSHKVKQLLKDIPEDRVFRTTFHPDCDYSTFVGCYKPSMDGDKIRYEFEPQVFTKAYIAAWNDSTKPVFMVIEEINRGNCAQVFGDLFQLLDRDKAGYSEYPVQADEALKQYLIENASGSITNGQLRLPPNLNILATMNTSDQSLFPMDSAFKRRWAWEYVPIDPDCPDSQFKITIGDKSYKWSSFLVKVNERIHNLSDSEDKQLGNFFIKSDIDVEEFKSKIMFYLWSEVCKEYEKSGSFFKDEKEVEFTFNSLFPTNEETDRRLQGFMSYLGVEEA